MEFTLILYLLLTLIISATVAYFQYYYKVKNRMKATLILFVLKTLSLFLIILLLINPKIEKLKTVNIKPVLSILVDDSQSISFFKEDKNVKNFVNSINNNTFIKDKFEIQQFVFNKAVQVLDSLSFLGTQTNISAAISNINELQKDKISPIVLITDGNQTIGKDYEFIKFKQPIYPIIFGDTVSYIDLKISQLNVNKYSYIKNKFPVEVILNYEGDKNVKTQFSIFSKGKTIFRKNVQFSKSKKSVTITANLTSAKEGTQYYSASIAKVENEKNITNNKKSFSVEVIDEQTKVLLLTSVLHPDLGTYKKAIESNKQRSVEIIDIDNFKSQVKDYQLIILYQPNNKFNTVIDRIIEENTNFLFVSGANTNWSFINQKQLGFTKNAISQTENYGTVYNDGFLTFLQEDIGFSNFPPLKDKFGEVKLSKDYQTLLYQNINGVAINNPLLATLDGYNQKSGILLGEGIWRWRANSFLNTNSFEEFDKFIGNLVQYLASNKKRNRLEVDSENLYPANSTIKITAFYTDKNYQFDDRANLEITIINTESKESTIVPFSLIGNSFQTEIENLASGDYTYKVSVLGQNINRFGRFKITNYQIEEQFTNANSTKLKKLAENTSGKVFYKKQVKEVIDELLLNESYYTVQKSSTKQENLIDWRWILFLIASLFTTEWFIRKYNGKI